VPRPSQPHRDGWDVYRSLTIVFLFLLALIATPSRAFGDAGSKQQDKAVLAILADQSPLVLKLSIHDTIQPITAEYLKRGLDAAASRHASAVLISMGTPGGLLESTRQMVADIDASPVPVILFIEPSGSRAGSAGFFLLESADIAAMAPGTNAGAAHPIIEGTTMDPVLKEKIENDAVAFLRSYTGIRGRDSAAAEDAVRNSKSYSADEALKLHLIDQIAPNDDALLAALNGRTIKRFNGASQTLNFVHADIVPMPPSTRERLLTRLTSPDLDVLLLMCGGLLIYLEFNVPGTIVPGALGTLMVLLAIFGLNLLPVQHTAILLLFAALALMVLEAKFASHGVLGIAGILCLVFGLATLVDGPTPEMRVHFGVAAGAGIGFGLITFGLAFIAFKARRAKRLTGAAAMLGHPAVAITPLFPLDSRTATQPTPGQPASGSPAAHTTPGQGPASYGTIGQVEVRGEIWQATLPPNSPPIPAGTPVTVRAINGLTLTVAP
jgi:membrane-bound serine protease (ClpP class)